jgi:hypothetical protein
MKLENKKAIRLLSKLLTARGKPQAEKLFYMFSQLITRRNNII